MFEFFKHDIGGYRALILKNLYLKTFPGLFVPLDLVAIIAKQII